jgi:peptidoglycan LD-endopeptidase CwlK
LKLSDLISEVQAALGAADDGAAGPETWTAVYNAIVKPNVALSLPASIEPVDARSEKGIATLLQPVQPIARALVHAAKEAGITIRVISGLRTYAEQDELYAQGRTKPGQIVTRVKGGYSNHNFGIAFDIGVFEGSKYLGASPKYKAVGMLGMQLGLEWGGNWKDFVDEPHFQLRPTWAKGFSQRELLAGLRQRVADGTDAFA